MEQKPVTENWKQLEELNCHLIFAKFIDSKINTVQEGDQPGHRVDLQLTAIFLTNAESQR